MTSIGRKNHDVELLVQKSDTPILIQFENLPSSQSIQSALAINSILLAYFGRNALYSTQTKGRTTSILYDSLPTNTAWLN